MFADWSEARVVLSPCGYATRHAWPRRRQQSTSCRLTMTDLEVLRIGLSSIIRPLVAESAPRVSRAHDLDTDIDRLAAATGHRREVCAAAQIRHRLPARAIMWCLRSGPRPCHALYGARRTGHLTRTAAGSVAITLPTNSCQSQKDAGHYCDASRRTTDGCDEKLQQLAHSTCRFRGRITDLSSSEHNETEAPASCEIGSTATGSGR